MKNNRGQSLLEIVVTLGLGLIIITGISIVAINGLKNSQFSKNQAVATKLAQEGLERVRQIRSQNCPTSIASTNIPWYNAGTTIYGNSNLNLVPPADMKF